MPKFHITKSGATAPCTASVKQCPLGGEEAHYDSVADAARASATRAMQESIASVPQAAPDAHREELERASESAINAITPARFNSGTDQYESPAREEFTPTALVHGLKEFYDPDSMNYSAGRKGVYLSERAAAWLLHNAGPKFPEETDAGFMVTIDPEVAMHLESVLSVVFDSTRTDDIVPWRHSTTWAKARGLYPAMFSELESQLEDAFYNRDLL